MIQATSGPKAITWLYKISCCVYHNMRRNKSDLSSVHHSEITRFVDVMIRPEYVPRLYIVLDIQNKVTSWTSFWNVGEYWVGLNLVKNDWWLNVQVLNAHGSTSRIKVVGGVDYIIRQSPTDFQHLLGHPNSLYVTAQVVMWKPPFFRYLPHRKWHRFDPAALVPPRVYWICAVFASSMRSPTLNHFELIAVNGNMIVESSCCSKDCNFRWSNNI